MAELLHGPGVTLGILSLDTRFQRIPGDVGNPESWPFPVLIRRVDHASPDRVVAGRAAGLVDAFADAAHALVAEGVDGIVSTCGFLVLHQAEFQRRVRVPVATSALMQLPLVARCLPGGRWPGVLTVSAASLTADHLAAAGADPLTPVEGLPPDGEFARVFLGNAETLDEAAAEAEMIAAARRLVTRHQGVGAIVLECANMPPYAAAVARATRLPVYDAIGFGTWFAAGLRPSRHSGARAARARNP